jgi:hypothetical protein
VARLPNLVHSGNPHFVYINEANKYQSLFFAAVHAALNKKDKSTVVALSIDQDLNINPLVMDMDLLQACFLGICTQGEAEKFNLPYSKTVFLDACEFPKDGPAPSAWFKQNGFASLDLAIESTLPVVAAFPKLLVTQPGSILPVDVPATTTGIATAMYRLDEPIIPEHKLVWYKATAFLATHFASMCLSKAVEVAGKAFTYNLNKLDLKVFHNLPISQFICLKNKQVPAMLKEHVDYHKYLSMTYESLGAVLTQLRYHYSRHYYYRCLQKRWSWPTDH